MPTVRRRGGVIVLLLGAVALPGCLATRQEIEDLRADIVRLQSKLQQTQTALQATLDKSQNALQGNQADLLAQMSSLNQNLTTLSSRLDENETRTAAFTSRFDDLDKNLSNRLDILNQTLTAAKVAAEKKTPPPSPSRLYQAAQNDLTRRRYAQAVEGFQDYLHMYPDTQKAADAQFSLGEIHFAQKKWPEAIEAYDAVLKKYPSARPAAAAALQKGIVLEKLGRKDEAEEAFDLVVKKYAHRPEAKTAKSHLSALKRNAAPTEPAKPAAAPAKPSRP